MLGEAGPASTMEPSVHPVPSRVVPWLATGFLMLCLVSILPGRPISTSYGILLAGFGMVLLGFAQRASGTQSSVTIWPMLLLLGVQALGCVVSVDPARSIARSASMPILALTFLAIQWAAQHRRAWLTTCWTGVAIALVLSADVLLARFAKLSLFHGALAPSTRVMGSHENPNDLAAAAFLLPMAWVVLPERRIVAWYLCIAALVTPVWVLGASRQVAFGWAVATLAPIAMHVGLRRAGWFLLAMTAGVALTARLDPLLRARVLETVQDGIGVRAPIITFGLWSWLQSPWLGHGPATFGELYRQGHVANWSWLGFSLPSGGMPWPHNLLVEILCDLGLMGLLAFAAVGRAMLARLRQGLVSGVRQRRLAIAALAMLGSIGVVSMIDLTLLKDWFRCILWMGIGLAFVELLDKPEPAPSPPSV